MTHMPLEAVAQDIVGSIKPLIGNRTLNIMNTDGRIIASSDPARIGTIHSGAALAVETGKIVRIQPEEAASYPGAKEGINLPIVKNGELMGVVGIYGKPEEVEQAANLLGVCVDLYLDQAQNARKKQMRKDLRLALIRRMLLGDILDREELLSCGRELSLDLRLPMRAAVAAPGQNGYGRQYNMERINRLYAAIGQGEWLDESHDVYAVVDDTVAMFKHTPPGFDSGGFIRDMQAKLQKWLGQPVTVALGGQCGDWRDLVKSHHEAQTLAEIMPGKCVSIDSHDAKVMYMMKGCLRSGVSDSYLASLHQSLARGYGERNLPKVMATVRAYVESGCSAGKAAEGMNIHKNTMNYRVNRIFALLGLEYESQFVREFYLRLLLLYHFQAAGREENEK